MKKLTSTIATKETAEKVVSNHLTNHRTSRTRSFRLACKDITRKKIFIPGSRIVGVVLMIKGKSLSEITFASWPETARHMVHAPSLPPARRVLALTPLRSLILDDSWPHPMTRPNAPWQCATVPRTWMSLVAPTMAATTHRYFRASQYMWCSKVLDDQP